MTMTVMMTMMMVMTAPPSTLNDPTFLVPHLQPFAQRLFVQPSPLDVQLDLLEHLVQLRHVVLQLEWRGDD